MRRRSLPCYASGQTPSSRRTVATCFAMASSISLTSIRSSSVWARSIEPGPIGSGAGIPAADR